MSRGIDPATEAEIAKGSQRFCSLIYMGFPAPLRMTDAGFDFDWGADTYLATDQILKLTTVEEVSETRVGSTSVTFSAVDQTIPAIFLNNSYIDIPYQYWKAWYGEDLKLIGSPVEFFAGQITRPKGTENAPRAEITIQIASEYAAWEYRNSRHTNLASQHIYFPSDMCFEFSGESMRDIRWGRK